ncbi:MAG: energy transducer TonB [Candidatus Accumulibacter sp.]|jgi:protein TonB|nr:energy transducer TonB [Accumulibacter sp.]
MPETPLGAVGLPELPGKTEAAPDADTVPETGGTPLTGTVSEALIKDTLQAGKPAEAPPAPTPDPSKKPEVPKRGARNAELPKKPGADRGRSSAAAKKVAPAVAEDAQRRLSERVFYPKEAIERGLEGTVYLIVRFTDDGSVADVDVAASSGHALLDNAAVRAAYAMGRQIGAASGELVLPVHFQLQD